MLSMQHHMTREGDIPQFKKGGTMKKSGAAKLHKGEHVTEGRKQKSKKKKSGRSRGR